MDPGRRRWCRQIIPDCYPKQRQHRLLHSPRPSNDHRVPFPKEQENPAVVVASSVCGIIRCFCNGHHCDRTSQNCWGSWKQLGWWGIFHGQGNFSFAQKCNCRFWSILHNRHAYHYDDLIPADGRIVLQKNIHMVRRYLLHIENSLDILDFERQSTPETVERRACKSCCNGDGWWL